MKNKQVIFITGTSYSGSTLLDMILSNDKNGFSLGEVNAFFRPYRKHHIEQIKIEQKKESILYKALLNGEKNLYKTIFESDSKIKFIVDSSKDVFWINNQIGNLNKQGIDYKVVLIYKTPEDLAYSFYKRNLLNNWQNHFSKFYKKLFYYNYDLIFVKSDEIISDNSSLEKLCNDLNIPYFLDKKDYWNTSHNTLFGNNRARVAIKGLDIIGKERIKDLSSKKGEKEIKLDKNISEEISNQIKKHISSNKVIDLIINDLSKKTQTVKYNSFQIIILKISYKLKRIIFRLFKK